MPDLRTLRHRHGLTIIEVAQRSGVAARAIAELEFGTRPFDSAERLALAHLYGVTPEDLKAPQIMPASRSWQNVATILSRQLILAALVSILMAVMLFREAVYGAESHAPAPSAKQVTVEPGLGARRRLTIMPPRSEGASVAVVPTMMPTVAPRLFPSAIPWPTQTATPQPTAIEAFDVIPADTPSPIPAATPEPVPTEMPNPLPTEVPSLQATKMPNSLPANAPSAAPAGAPSPTPEAPSPIPQALGPSSPAVPQKNSVFMPLPVDGLLHQNVMAALVANNGALQHVVIPPDATWSFNRSIGDPNLLQLDLVYGVPGGGWCDLASRYLMVLRPFQPPESFAFIRHVDSTGYGLEGVSDDDAVVIWNSNGGSDEQDLRVHNTSGRTISIDVTLVADGVQFQATLK